MATIKNTQKISSVDKSEEKLEPSYTADDTVWPVCNNVTNMEISVIVPQKY